MELPRSLYGSLVFRRVYSRHPHINDEYLFQRVLDHAVIIYYGHFSPLAKKFSKSSKIDQIYVLSSEMAQVSCAVFSSRVERGQKLPEQFLETLSK